MITIDMRWVNVSGIGTYLKNVVPGIVSAFPERRFVLLGKREAIASLPFADCAKIDIVDADTKMYSVAEQFEIPAKIPKETDLFFAPHYNIPLAYRAKMLVTVYDLFHVAMPELVGGLHKRFYAKAMFGAVRRRANTIITISNFTRAEFVRYTGVPMQPLHAIHLGISKEWFAIPQKPSPHRKPYILYVGNIKPHKNLKLLIKAFISVADCVPHDLVLVGKKEGFITGDQEVLALAESLPGRIHFTGWVSDELLHQYFRHADTMVFPSLYEGFGLPPLEAMAAGCPVVVSDAGPLPEVCGDAALYFNPFDVSDLAEKLTRVLSDAELQASLRNRGLKRSRIFTWDGCVKQTCDVIENLLETPPYGVK